MIWLPSLKLQFRIFLVLVNLRVLEKQAIREEWALREIDFQIGHKDKVMCRVRSAKKGESERRKRGGGDHPGATFRILTLPYGPPRSRPLKNESVMIDLTELRIEENSSKKKVMIPPGVDNLNTACLIISAWSL